MLPLAFQFDRSSIKKLRGINGLFYPNDGPILKINREYISKYELILGSSSMTQFVEKMALAITQQVLKREFKMAA